MNKRATKSKSNHKMYSGITKKKHLFISSNSNNNNSAIVKKRAEEEKAEEKTTTTKNGVMTNVPTVGKNDSIVAMSLLTHYTFLIVILAQVILVLFFFHTRFFSLISLSLSAAVARFASVMNLDWFYTTLNSIEGLYFYCCFYGTSAGARVYAYRWLAHQRFMCTRFVQVIDSTYTLTIFVVSFAAFFFFRFTHKKSRAKRTNDTTLAFNIIFAKIPPKVRNWCGFFAELGLNEFEKKIGILSFPMKNQIVALNCSCRKKSVLLSKPLIPFLWFFPIRFYWPIGMIKKTWNDGCFLNSFLFHLLPSSW